MTEKQRKHSILLYSKSWNTHSVTWNKETTQALPLSKVAYQAFYIGFGENGDSLSKSISKINLAQIFHFAQGNSADYTDKLIRKVGYI